MRNIIPNFLHCLFLSFGINSIFVFKVVIFLDSWLFDGTDTLRPHIFLLLVGALDKAIGAGVRVDAKVLKCTSAERGALL